MQMQLHCSFVLSLLLHLISSIWQSDSKLEEVEQQPSINDSFGPVTQLVKMNNFFGQYFHGDCLEKPL